MTQPHSGQRKTLSESRSSLRTCLQWQQVFEAGNHLLTRIRREPRLQHYSSMILVKFPHPLSDTDFPNFRACFIADISRSSIAMIS